MFVAYTYGAAAGGGVDSNVYIVLEILPSLKGGDSYWFHAKAGIPSVGSCHLTGLCALILG